MRKPTSLAILVAFTLAACGGNDPTASAIPESTTEAPDEFAEEPEDCSLTEEQIGDDTMDVLGSYLIDGDTLLCSPTAEAAETFAIFTDLVPAEYREGVIGFVAISQEDSDGTDGAMQDVWGPDDEPTGERYLALDVTGSSVELERTIVHEVGHTIFITAGSDDPTGYTADFNEQFAPGGSYEESPEDFVSEYASSQPDGSEDMAESWAMFVFGDTEYAGDADDDGELDVVEPGTIAAEKVAFFESYSELVDLRDSIRTSAGF